MSTEELRTFFDVTTGFDMGELYFADAGSSLDQCPAYDQSAVVYVSPIDEALLPPELQGQSHLVKFVWGLNGIRYIALGPDERVDPMPDGYLRYTPIEACTVLDANLGQMERDAYVAAVEAAHPDVPTSYLSEIGVFCWGGTGDVSGPPEQGIVDGADAQLRADVYALADDIRGDAEIGAIEWSTYLWGFPSLFELGTTIDAATFYPECLRTTTRDLLDRGVDFASLPSFPEPIGQGWITNDQACQ